jgi:hypothetical protein
LEVWLFVMFCYGCRPAGFADDFDRFGSHEVADFFNR